MEKAVPSRHDWLTQSGCHHDAQQFAAFHKIKKEPFHLMTETMMDQHKANTIDYHPEPPRSGITSRVGRPLPPTLPFVPQLCFWVLAMLFA